MLRNDLKNKASGTDGSVFCAWYAEANVKMATPILGFPNLHDSQKQKDYTQTIKSDPMGYSVLDFKRPSF
jgi:hypothetical protein